jgi:hypothetical protein
LNYLIAGLEKSGTTILFSRMQQAIRPKPRTYFEPDNDNQLLDILHTGNRLTPTLTKVLIGRVSSCNELLKQFQRHIVIHRDPRDQFISMLLYMFYDFQLSGDKGGYTAAREALANKVKSPEIHSTLELYNLIATLVGRAPIAVFNKLHREQQAYIQVFSPKLLRYEDFIDNKVQQIEDYLGFGIGNQVEVPPEYRRVARSRAYGDWRFWLNEDDLTYINREWGDAIQSLGYPLQRVPGTLFIQESTTLDYVSQFDPAP